MICPKCNNEISEESVFCPSCGYKLGSVEQPKPKKKLNINVNWKKLGIILAAIVIVAAGSTVGYINSTPEACYNRATKAYENLNYAKAMKLYARAGSYKDSKAKLNEVEIAYHYEQGNKLLDKEKYEEALEEYEQTSFYEETTQKKEICNYHIGLASKEAGNYLEACKAFKNANGYEDSDKQIKEIAKKVFDEGNYKEADEMYQLSEGWERDANANYAHAMVFLEKKEYGSAAKYLKKSGRYSRQH